MAQAYGASAPWLRHGPDRLGQFPGAGDEENPTCETAELAQAGETGEAYALLMDALGTDLRCIDAHAHLGNLAFDHSPNRAIVHYEIGVRIGELSLPPGFDGAVLWGHIYNRPRVSSADTQPRALRDALL